MRLLFSLLLLFIATSGFSQDIGQLIAQAKKEKNPQKRIDKLNQCIEQYWQSGKFQEGLKLAGSTLEDARKIHYRSGEAIALNHIGTINDFLGDYGLALKNYYTALAIQEKAHDYKGIAYTCSNIGLVYGEEGRNGAALEFHLRSLSLRSKINDQSGISASRNNLGIVYMNLRQFDKALYHFNQSLQADLKRKNSHGLADTYNNIGLVYMDKKDFRKAIRYFHISEKYRVKNGDVVGKGTEWVNLGITYMHMGDNKKAKAYFEKATPLAEKYKALALAQFAETNYAKILEDEGNYKEALKHYKKETEIEKTLKSDDATRLQTETEMQYSYDKENARRNFRIEKDRERTTIILWSVVGLLIIAGGSAIVIFRRWKITNYQKHLIEEKNKLVETKNREILDSIMYAKRIQKALLPSLAQLRGLFPESFVLYKPKDIVAGDFYWTETKGDTVFFAVGDCTGHGVPGALVSVVCINALNKSVLEYGLTDPASILEKTRAIVLDEFERSEEQVNDGMDISLIAWNAKSGKLTYSGANNSLWIVKNGMLTELSASKQPIGVYHRYSDFDNQEVQIEGGERVYLFTDGYADQFGGNTGKKYKSSRLKRTLTEHSESPEDQQCRQLDQIFEEWKGDNEQIDDVCIVGIRF